jgi:4-hydroxybenzoate polyprenyltransferase
MSMPFYHKLKKLSVSHLIERLSAYALLMRLHRPIGSLLLLWPTLIALWLASKGEPDWHLVWVFMLGVIVMRSAGCVINDICDRHIDGHVARTEQRPLVTGKVSLKEACWLFGALLLFAFFLVCLTNRLTLILSLGGAFLASCYPLMKRYTYFPQVILGAAFGWAIPMAYAAHSQSFPLDCWILYAATILWAVAYDTLYAMVDKKDDLKIKVKSTAIVFGQFDKMWVGI